VTLATVRRLPRTNWPIRVHPYVVRGPYGGRGIRYELRNHKDVAIGRASYKGDAYLWANALAMYHALETVTAALEAAVDHLPADEADIAREAVAEAQAVIKQVKMGVLYLCPICHDVDRPLPMRPITGYPKWETRVFRCPRCERDVHRECARDAWVRRSFCPHWQMLCLECAEKVEAGERLWV